MTESLKGTVGFVSAAASKTEPGSTMVNAVPAAVLANSRRFINSSSRFSGQLCSPLDSSRAQQFTAHILEHVHRPLHTYFAGKNRHFVLDAENPLVAHFHVSSHNLFP